MLHKFGCHPCTGAMLILCVSFQFQHRCCQSEHSFTVFSIIQQFLSEPYPDKSYFFNQDLTVLSLSPEWFLENSFITLLYSKFLSKFQLVDSEKKKKRRKKEGKSSVGVNRDLVLCLSLLVFGQVLVLSQNFYWIKLSVCNRRYFI